MKYLVELKTEKDKDNIEFGCNDFDRAILHFKACVNSHWDIIGDVEIILSKFGNTVVNDVRNREILYRLIKSY